MKKRIASIALSLAMCLTLLPTAAYAEDVSEGGAFDSQSSTGNGAAVYTNEDTVDDTSANKVNVSTKDELEAALANNDVNIIYITDSFKYTDSIATGDKKIVVNEGVTLTIGGSKTKITGKFENNGTITINSSYECIWKAQTTGSGKIVANNQKWGEYQTYVDYGCVPEENLTDCRINIVKDIDKEPTVILPETMTVGDTITPTVTNLIDGVEISKVFQYKWKDGNSSQIYDGAAQPTLTKAGTLKLTLAAKKPYIMRSASGSYGSIDATGTVQKLTLHTVYVDAFKGSNSNIGNATTAPLKTISKAIDEVEDGGTIILLSDATSSVLSFDKNVTIKSDEGEKYTVNATSTYIKDNVTATFESVDAQNLIFWKWDNDSRGSGNVVFKNCTGSGIQIADNVIKDITLENSQLGGRFGAQGILTLKNATINGSFSTKDFVAKGNNIYVPTKNYRDTSRIEGKATIENAVEIQLSAPDPTTPYQERKLIEISGNLNNFTVLQPYESRNSVTLNRDYISAFVPVTGVTLTPDTLSIEEGKTAELTATISPANASDQQFSWNVKDTEIASVYGYTSKTKTVKALKKGQTQITVTVGGQTASCTVTVTPRTISVESITLNKTQLSLVKGATETLTATVLPTTATDKTVIWESSDTAVATVENGVVTAVAAGNATITATAGGKTAICAVTVTNPSNSGSSSGGGGSSTPRYAVTVPDKTENGSLSVTPKNAKKGSDVTITATPDKGCEVDAIVAKDANGNKLTLKDNGDGTYTFTMPASKVTIEATFAEKQAEPIVPEKLFADVSADDYYYEAVKWASENGVTGGIGENLFGAKLPCTRAQIVTFLWRAAGSPEPKGMSGFVDVSADAYYAKAVAWAVEQGIVSGTSATTFSPDAVCTRAQSVAFLYRAFGEKVNKAAGFSDVSADAYYADAVAWAVENGVASGIGGGLFAPDQDCARGQIVAFLYRAYQNK